MLISVMVVLVKTIIAMTITAGTIKKVDERDVCRATSVRTETVYAPELGTDLTSQEKRSPFASQSSYVSMVNHTSCMDLFAVWRPEEDAKSKPHHANKIGL